MKPKPLAPPNRRRLPLYQPADKPAHAIPYWMRVPACPDCGTRHEEAERCPAKGPTSKLWEVIGRLEAWARGQRQKT